MALTAGIVGLPNVGKSTLFNAITKAGAEAANYPFATIDPNVGMVEVPDERLQKLTEMITPVFLGVIISVNFCSRSSGTSTIPTFGSMVAKG